MKDFVPSKRLVPLLLDPKQPFIHRDLSWVQFNARVLNEANSPDNPILEKLKFLSITASNLDEFFMIRMASLGRSIASEFRKGDSPQLQHLRRIRAVILGNVSRYMKQQAQTLIQLKSELAQHGIEIVYDSKNIKDRLDLFALAKGVFDEKILPELTFPEPYSAQLFSTVDNLQIIAFFGHEKYLKVPRKLRAAYLKPGDKPNKVYIFFLDHLLEIFLAQAFGFSGEPLIARLTRDADMSVELEEEDSESIPDVVLSSLKKRERGRPVRIQNRGKLSKEVRYLIFKQLKLSKQQIFEDTSTLCLHGLWSIIGEVPDKLTKQTHMTYTPMLATIPPEIKISKNIFDQLKKHDFLLHHPYDSFDSYVDWIKSACEDPHTTMIQQTVYRMDALSPVIDSLKKAAKKKTIKVVIELRARFDEMNNLKLSEELRNAGVQVTFGFGNLKLHAKIALVARLENGVPQYYTHLSTGNYNSITARQYTDLSILTANKEIGEDALHFFDSVWKNEIPSSFKKLVPAPTKLHRKIISLIESEMAAAKEGKPARIVGKVNTLVDHAVVEKLYLASQAGVKIDLVVRGACALIPGVPGLSENIRVISIVDRFLEHSRIYYFSSTNTLYLSSADWMPRNFFSRLELAFPVVDPRLHQYITEVILPTYLNDRAKAQELTSDGAWKKRPPIKDDKPLRAQFHFEDLALKKYKGTPIEFR
jgi:polyphosphate kinase